MIQFANRVEGRIAVYCKMNDLFTDTESIGRIRTIKYCNTLKEYRFYQGFFGRGSRLDGDTLFKVAMKLKELDGKRVV